MTKKILTLSAVVIAWLFIPSFANAADLKVNCNNGSNGCIVTGPPKPLFNENNLVPGERIIKEIEVKNNRNEACSLELDINNVTFDQVNLAERLFSNISGSNPSINNISLVALENTEIKLGSIPAGVTNNFTWEVLFDLSAGNDYKGTTTSFNFDLIFECSAVSGQVAGATDNKEKKSGKVLGAIHSKIPSVLGMTSFPKAGLPIQRFLTFFFIGGVILVLIVNYILPRFNKSPRL